jgi:hypothetical protein
MYLNKRKTKVILDFYVLIAKNKKGLIILKWTLNEINQNWFKIFYLYEINDKTLKIHRCEL